MTLSFDDLSTEVVEQAEQTRSLEEFMKNLLKEKPIPTALAKRPDALVQVTIDTTCRGCSKVYSRPNRALLLRYGRKHLRVRFWHQVYESLPRETERLTEVAPTCEVCFENRLFFFLEENNPEDEE